MRFEIETVGTLAPERQDPWDEARASAYIYIYIQSSARGRVEPQIRRPARPKPLPAEAGDHHGVVGVSEDFENEIALRKLFAKARSQTRHLLKEQKSRDKKIISRMWGAFREKSRSKAQ